MSGMSEGEGLSHRVRDIESCGASFDDILKNAIQELWFTAACIFRTELNVLATSAAEIRHCLDSIFHNLQSDQAMLMLAKMHRCSSRFN